jgi:Flp pilus assembly protein TadG
MLPNFLAALFNPALLRCRRGNVAIIAALAAIPLIGAVGLAVDYTRALQFKTSLQGACDSAALAGASLLSSSTGSASTMATDYIKSEIAKLPPNNGITYTVSVPNSSTVTVSATGQLATTFMSIFTKSFGVTTAATAGPAQGPGGTVTWNLNLGGFYSSAADSNTIYWYIVPADNSIPPNSALQGPLASNNPAIPVSSTSFTVGQNQKIGFALVNVTGGLSNYGSNQYGGTPGTTHTFYSSISPPSSSAYPSSGENNLKICSGQAINSCPNAGNNDLSTPNTAAPSCATLGSGSTTFAWNDMGGPKDDYDYNDMEYYVSCSSGSGGGGGGFGQGQGSASSGVVLIK